MSCLVYHPPHRVAAQSIYLKALLQRQPASFEANVHESGAGEVGVGEYWKHPRSLPLRFSVRMICLSIGVHACCCSIEKNDL